MLKPVYLYVRPDEYYESDHAGCHLYTWSPADENLAGYDCVGIAFYAATEDAGGWTRLDRYVDAEGRRVYALQAPGAPWTLESGNGRSIWVAPPGTAGTVPLQEYVDGFVPAIRRYVPDVGQGGGDWSRGQTFGGVGPRVPFDDTYAVVLRDVVGYAHMRRDAAGNVLDAGGSGVDGSTVLNPLTPDTRVSLGVAGDAIAAVAAFRMAQDGWLKLSDTALGLLGTSVVVPVDSTLLQVTVDDLLQHKSGMAFDKGIGLGTITDIPTYLGNVFAMNGVAPHTVPGPYAFNPLDTTLLNAVLDAVARAHTNAQGQAYRDFVDYVTQVILAPLGIDTAVFSTQPDPALTRARATTRVNEGPGKTYDFQGGSYFPWFSWIASPRALLQFVQGVRTNRAILSEDSWARLTSGVYPWIRAADGTIYFGGDNYYGYDETVEPPYAGLAVAAACLAEPDGSFTDAVLFTVSRCPDVLAAMNTAHGYAPAG